MVKIELPVWLQKGVVNKLGGAAHAWWQWVAKFLPMVVRQRDADDCHVGSLTYLGGERGVNRYADETDKQYRQRVMFASLNAKDAGKVSGFTRIFQRLGIGVVEQEERLPGLDWDIVAVKVTDAQLEQHAPRLKVVLNDYGRTCRRYYLTTEMPVPVTVTTAEVGNSNMMLEASL